MGMRAYWFKAGFRRFLRFILQKRAEKSRKWSTSDGSQAPERVAGCGIPYCFTLGLERIDPNAIQSFIIYPQGEQGTLRRLSYQLFTLLTLLGRKEASAHGILPSLSPGPPHCAPCRRR